MLLFSFFFLDVTLRSNIIAITNSKARVLRRVTDFPLSLYKRLGMTCSAPKMPACQEPDSSLKVTGEQIFPIMNRLGATLRKPFFTFHSSKKQQGEFFWFGFFFLPQKCQWGEGVSSNTCDSCCSL